MLSLSNRHIACSCLSLWAWSCMLLICTKSALTIQRSVKNLRMKLRINTTLQLLSTSFPLSSSDSHLSHGTVFSSLSKSSHHLRKVVTVTFLLFGICSEVKQLARFIALAYLADKRTVVQCSADARTTGRSCAKLTAHSN